MAPIRDRSHYYCWFCGTRIKTNKAVRLGVLSLEVYTHEYGKICGETIDPNGHSCQKCALTLKHENYLRLHDKRKAGNQESMKVFHTLPESRQFVTYNLPIICPNTQSSVDSQCSTVYEDSEINDENRDFLSEGSMEVLDSFPESRDFVIEKGPITIYPNSSQSTVDSQCTTLYDDSQIENDPDRDLISRARTNNSQMPLSSQDSSLNSSDSMASSQTSSQSSISVSQSSCFSLAESTIKLDINMLMRTMSKCCICNKVKGGRSRIPRSAIVNAWHRKQIMIPFSNRCCKDHIGENGLFHDQVIKDLTAKKDTCMLSSNKIKEYFIAFAEEGNGPKYSKIDFDIGSPLSDYDYKNLTGLSRANFDDLLMGVCVYLRNSSNRSTRNALGLFLVKIRLNLSHQFLGFLFEIDSLSKVSSIFESVRKVLELHFVPKHLGYGHLTREEAKQHQTKMASILFEREEDSLAVVADGTYLYVQKSTDHKLQKLTYSNHKKRNLLKPMVFTFTNGYILEVEGLFYADNANNDAKIMKYVVDKPYGFATFIKEGDQLVLDRGYRDIIDDLETMGYKTFMPRLLKKGVKQFSTEDANQSRIVTMTRWVIEAVNGRLKKYKFFASVIEASYFPKLGSLVRIACALMNKYSPPILTENTRHENIALLALQRVGQINQMKEKVENLQLVNKRIVWVEEEIVDFPHLSDEDLTYITLGVYQIEMAEHYARQHIGPNANYKIYIHREIPNILRAKIESRFTSGHFHQLWIEFDSNKDGENSIVSYYCLCKVGSRVLGCCSHIACVLWYLGNARHNPEVMLRERKNLSDNILNASDVFHNENEDLDGEM